MPNFINNTGRGYVPSLQTIVAVSPHLTAEHINQLPQSVARWTIELRRTCGIEFFVNAEQIPLYIAGEHCSNNVALPYDSAEANFNHPNAEEIPYYNNWWQKSSKRMGKRRPWGKTRVNQFLASWIPRTETVVCSTNTLSIKSVPYDSKFALFVPEDDWKYFSNSALKDETKVESVQRVFLQGYCCAIMTSFFYSFPRLTSIDISCKNLNQNWSPLSLFAETLQELKLVVPCLTFSDEQQLLHVISRFNRLQVLSLCSIIKGYQAHLPGEDPFTSLTASPELRSIYLHNVRLITPMKIIHYLKGKILHNGEMVERQEIFSDLTLIGYELSDYEALFGSNELSQSMKDNIYCDKDIHHLSAAMVLVYQRDKNFTSTRMRYLSGKARGFVMDRPQPSPVLLSLVLHEIRSDPNWHKEYLPNWLLRNQNVAEQYEPTLLSFATATLSSFFSKRDKKVTKTSRVLPLAFRYHLMELIRILDQLVEVPPNIPAYLKMLLNLMLCDGPSGGLPSMFVKQANKLTEIELKEFVADHMGDLRDLIGNCDFSTKHPLEMRPFRKRFPFPPELDELLLLIQRSTKSVLLRYYIRKMITANASIPAPASRIAFGYTAV